MRADLYLVSNGYYESRARAQAAIKAGLVKVDGKRLKKASEKLSDLNDISAKAEHPWVSRGGLKLAYALKEFKVSVENKICLDVGASTGGFSDVLRQKGAARVYAVDVGHGQLHASLHDVAEIISMEGQDARELTAEHFDITPQLIVCDASFISAMKVLETPLTLAATSADLITLVKPQFEVGKAGIGRGGLVKSESLALQALSDVSAWVTAQGWHVTATCTSPIKGGSGNTEYLLHARKN
ncbi:TlyA family RNA methyltransferase [Hellea balneolensis]|uniref:TlyA family RNA methyltransferase n=1 Tax=Hellea balneolensis TaxID=287478 RepID=UPI0003F7C850|nr:TlyA family RNA methyltransferase [Hellea balneolensis]